MEPLMKTDVSRDTKSDLNCIHSQLVCYLSSFQEVHFKHLKDLQALLSKLWSVNVTCIHLSRDSVKDTHSMLFIGTERRSTQSSASLHLPFHASN